MRLGEVAVRRDQQIRSQEGFGNVRAAYSGIDVVGRVTLHSPQASSYFGTWSFKLRVSCRQQLLNTYWY